MKLWEGNVFSRVSLSVQLSIGPYCTGTPWTQPSPPDMLKLVYYEAHTIDKWAVRNLLECFLVLSTTV